MAFCPQCGREVEKNHIFCPQCGYRYGEAAETLPNAEAKPKALAATASPKSGKTFLITVISLSFVALLLAAGAVWFALPLIRGDGVKAVDPSGNTGKSEVDDGGTDQNNGGASVQTGFIEGTLGYPAGYFPEDMMVCAYNLDTGLEYWIDSGGNTAYQIEVPPGRYHVFAYLDSYPGYRAYYNEFVEGGMTAELEQGDPIEVVVRAGEVAGNVNPVDWYHDTPDTDE
jgi:hypothetical protein